MARPTVLVVDDHEDVREAIAAGLDAAEFGTTEAATGEDALRLVLAGPAAVVRDGSCLT